MSVEENEETSWDKSVAMCDNDEQLIPLTPNRSKSLYDGSGDIDNDLRNLVQRKPKPHSQCLPDPWRKGSYNVLTDSQKKNKSLKLKMTYDDQAAILSVNHVKPKY